MSTITVGEVLQTIKSFAPEDYSYNKEYDNIGLILGREDVVVNKILCCLDVTEKVIDEAINLGFNLIISHHPMIFNPIYNITSASVVGRKILKAAEHGINIYAAHTNLDFVRDGINDFVASLLGLRNCVPLDPYIDGEQGFGRVGELSSRLYCSDFKAQVESALKDKYVRIIGEPYIQVKKIAVINGGGGGDTKYIDMSLKAGADCLVTGDIKHHVAMYALESGLTIIEPQHFCMEYCYISRLVQILKIEAKAHKIELEIAQSQIEVNPRF